MKLSYKLMMFSLVGMVAAPMFIIKPDGKPMMTASDWMPSKSTINKVVSKFDSVVNSATNGEVAISQDSEQLGQDVIPEFAPPGSGKIYSWKDAKGVMHFSEQPPPSDIKTARVRNQTTNVNVIKSVKVPKAEDNSAQYGGGGQFKFALPTPTTIPVSQIPKLVNDAKRLQEVADKRGEALGKI